MAAQSASRRLVVLIALAALSTAVLSARVYTRFDRVRIRVVRTAQAPVRGVATVSVPDVSRLVGRPATLTLELSNPTSAPLQTSIRVNDAEVGRPLLRASRTSRVDVSVPRGFPRPDENVISIAGPDDRWTLDLLEVGNAYGFSSGHFSMLFVPAGLAGYGAAPPWATVLVGLLLVVVPWRWSRPVSGRWPRAIHAAVAWAAVGVMAVVVVLPWTSAYKVLLSGEAFAWCMVGLHGPPVSAWAMARLRQDRTARGFGRRLWQLAAASKIRLLYLGAVAIFLVSVAKAYDPQTGFTNLILFTAAREARVLPALRDQPHATFRDGYDGQFYAQLALDPLTRDPGIERAMDSFSYRARRMLFSWTAFILGLGRPAWILQAYALQNVACWLLTAWLLLRWMPPRDGRRFFVWFACLFGYGLIVSVRRSLLEGPSLLLVVLAVWAAERRRPWLATAIVGVSGLGRETNLLGAASWVERVPRRWQDAVRLAFQILIVVLPVVSWGLLLRMWHPAAMVDITGTRNFAMPLAAYVGKWSATIQALRSDGGDLYARYDLLALVSVGVQVVWLGVRRNWQDPWYRVAAAYALLMTVLGPAVWEGFPGAFTRVLLPLAVAFNVLLIRGRFSWPVAIAGNLTLLLGLKELNFPLIAPYL